MIELSCTKNRLMCGHGALIHDSGSTVDIKATGCRSWSCEVCAPLRMAQCQVRARLGRPNKFLTLTCNPALGVSPTARRKMMGEAFALLIKRIQREINQKVEYFAWCEQHVSGEPHLHVFLRCRFIHWTLIMRWWKELTGAYRVNIKQIYNKKAMSSYLNKYVTKGMKKYGNCKRYWMSRNYILPPEEGEPVKEWQPRKWSFSKQDIDRIELSYRVTGWWRVPGEIERGVRQLRWFAGGIPPPPRAPRV